MSFLSPLRSLAKRIIFRLEHWLFSKITKGRNAWQIFDKAGIEGFGINLNRLYFPIYYDKKTNRQTFCEPVQRQITALIKAGNNFEIYNAHINAILKTIVKLPVRQTDNTLPYLDNYFFGIYDAAVLFSIMTVHKPGKVIEIGSGISTRYIRYFKEHLSLTTQIVCIDPTPRVDIADVADSVITEPFENVIVNFNLDLQSDDIVFMDGSHYVFQGNDTLTFFFDFLPRLPKGVIIHIHDIYLPFDYPEGVARQLWTEQYILAAMIVGGFKGFEIIYPAYYMSQTDNIKQALKMAGDALTLSEFKLNINHKEGYSFWIRKI